MFDTWTIDLRRSTHQSPIFEGHHIDHRFSKVNTSISEGRHIEIRRSTHRDIDLRRATHDLRRATYRSLKVDTSIIDLCRESFPRRSIPAPGAGRIGHAFAGRLENRIVLRFRRSRKSTHRSSKIEGGNITPTIRRRILSTCNCAPNYKSLE